MKPILKLIAKLGQAFIIVHGVSRGLPLAILPASTMTTRADRMMGPRRASIMTAWLATWPRGLQFAKFESSMCLHRLLTDTACDRQLLMQLHRASYTAGAQLALGPGTRDAPLPICKRPMAAAPALPPVLARIRTTGICALPISDLTPASPPPPSLQTLSLPNPQIF